MVQMLRNIADSPWFQNFITTVIIFAGILVGAETYPDFAHKYHKIMDILDKIIIAIFVLEVLVKMGAELPKPLNYFKDPWNIFDFIIVVACFLPVSTQYVMVLRLARLLRVLKLVRALPKLQILVGALLKSIPSMAYVTILLLLMFYVYAVAATFMFSDNDPIHFESLELSMLSLFRAVTLEDWTDLMYIQMYGCDNYGYDGNEALCTAPKAYPLASPLLFVSFVLFGTMVILNLFIGVIMNGMDEARAEADEEKRKSRGERESTVEEDLGNLADQIDLLQKSVKNLQRKARLTPSDSSNKV